MITIRFDHPEYNCAHSAVWTKAAGVHIAHTHLSHQYLSTSTPAAQGQQVAKKLADCAIALSAVVQKTALSATHQKIVRAHIEEDVRLATVFDPQIKVCLCPTPAPAAVDHLAEQCVMEDAQGVHYDIPAPNGESFIIQGHLVSHEPGLTRIAL